MSDKQLPCTVTFAGLNKELGSSPESSLIRDVSRDAIFFCPFGVFVAVITAIFSYSGRSEDAKFFAKIFSEHTAMGSILTLAIVNFILARTGFRRIVMHVTSRLIAYTSVMFFFFLGALPVAGCANWFANGHVGSDVWTISALVFLGTLVAPLIAVPAHIIAEHGSNSACERIAVAGFCLWCSCYFGLGIFLGKF